MNGKKTKSDLIIVLLFSLLLAFIIAINKVSNGDFIAFNGDFQSYNLFRRILDGQIQYRDFINYLGIGVIFVNIPFLTIFNNFGASVFITNFTTAFIYCIMIFVLLYALSGKRKLASFGTVFCASLSYYVMLIGGIHTNWIVSNVLYGAINMGEIGISARTTRAFLPYLMVIIFFSVYKLMKPKKYGLTVSKILLYGVIVGMLIPWSNDYGYSCVGCSFILLMMLEILYYRHGFFEQLKRYSVFLVSAVAGMLLTLLIITCGDIKSYFEINEGIISYQFWYYGNVPSKFFTLKDIFDGKYTIITIVFFVYAIHFSVKLIQRKFKLSELIRLFLLSTNYAASLIYVIGSGSHNTGGIELVLVFCLFFTVINSCKKFKDKYIVDELLQNKMVVFLKANKKYSYYILLCCGIVFQLLLINLYFEERKMSDESEKQYIEGLNVSSLIAKDIEPTAAQIVDGDIFSTYASALEVIMNKYQPSGVDYIIHVLGDELREEYISVFKEGEYEYVSTLKNDYTIWEYWVSRANWFFYRELYSEYTPYLETNYSVIWKKADDSNVIDTNFNVEIIPINESSVKIIVNTLDTTDAGYVDLCISYNTIWKENRIKQMAFRKAVALYDGGEQYTWYEGNACYYLPANAVELAVPVPIKNGYGEIVISAAPNSCTELINVDASAIRMIAMPEYGLRLVNYRHIAQGILESILDENRTLVFVNTEYNKNLLLSAIELKANGESVQIESVEVINGYIYVRLKAAIDPNNFAYPNVIETVRGCKLVHVCDSNWDKGIRNNEPCLLIDSNVDTSNLENVEVDDVKKKVVKVSNEGAYKYIILEDREDIEKFAYPANIKFITAQE